jgi:hypothetical protein
VKDRFWFTSTFKISSLNQFVLGNYNPNGTQGIDDNRITNGTVKLSYQMPRSSQLHYTYSRNLKYRFHRPRRRIRKTQRRVFRISGRTFIS